MCGIAGVMMKNGMPPADATLDALLSALAHRGPDGEGRHVHGDVGLVQNRLAIIDLETGDQPFSLERPGEGPIALVANGEIYNYRELREELSGVSFTTQSDCEPPLHLYVRHGTTYAARLRGMYAIAIHDPVVDRLVLSRDPFGIKPLYFTETDEAFAFASEPQALLSAGMAARAAARESCLELLQLQFTTGRQTVFAGIQRVLPGETLVVRAGRIIERHRVQPLPLGRPAGQGEEAALADLDGVLEDAVELHQRSDVPYGMFLSGGIDSSALLAMMRRLNDEPVRAFTVGFSGTGVHDERDHARAVAKAAGAEHTEVEFSEADFWTLLPAVAGAMDDPAADYAVLPTYKLAEAVHAAGLKVVLSGEGGDEMFAGYGRYRRAARSRLLGGRRMRATGVLQGLGVLRDDGPGWRAGLDAIEADLPSRLTGLQRSQAADCGAWLPNDLLTKLDRCLMAHGVEGRVPFVDPAVAGFGFRLADVLKVRRGLGKHLLRKWLQRHMPESLPFSKKRGFTVPVAEWIKSKGKELGPLVAGQAGVQSFCRPEVVRALFRASGKREGQAQWALLFFALWHERHILGSRDDGDVYEVLGA